MTALPNRRLPSRADEAALSALRTRSPTTAGSTRWTNDGTAETSAGFSRGSGAEVGAAGARAGISSRVTRIEATARFIDFSIPFRSAPRPAGPQPRDGLQHAKPFRCAPRPAGPQPRDGLQRANPARYSSAVAVLSFVIRAELSGLERAPPRFVLFIPIHGRPQGVTEPVAWRPAELVRLLGVDRVAPVVAGAILHGLDQGLGLTGQLEDLSGKDDVLHLVATADVVDLTVDTLAEHQVDTRAVVEDVEPIAHVAAVAIERQGLVVERVRDEEWDDLLGVLVRAEVVGRARDHDGDAMGVPVGQREQIAAGLGRRVRVRWPHRIALARGAALDRAVHLVGADVQQARDLQLAHRLEQGEDTEHVGLEEGVGLHERAIDVRLGREVHDGVDPAARVTHDLGVADVALDERVARVALEIGQVGGISRVGQLVEIDDAVVRVRGEDVADEVGADEAAAAGDQELHRASLGSRPRSRRRRSPTAAGPRRTSPARARNG